MPEPQEKYLVIITGPTATGKTKAAMAVAKHFGIPVISADSRQMYRQLPIGTAQPAAEEQKEVRHLFTATLELDEYYSAAMYEQEVLKVIELLHRDSPIALMAGGSMMYIDAVCKGIDDIPTIRDDIRQQVKSDLEEKGLQQLLEELKEKDPQYFAEADKNNTRRIAHAIEIIRQTGDTYSSLRTKTHKQRPFKIIKIGLTLPREQLYERINERVLQMVEQGLIEEAKAVYPKRELNSLNTVGYKELFKYFDGKISLEEAIRQIQSNTREYARKQMTWYRRDTEIQWFHPTAHEAIINYINKQMTL